MDLNAIDNGTEDWNDEDWNDDEWDYWDSDINAMDWDWYDPYDVNALDLYDADTDTWYSSWDDWNEWTEDEWSMNALHYQTPTVSPQQQSPTQVTQTIVPQQGTMMALPSTQPPTQPPNQPPQQQLPLTQPSAAPTYAPGTYSGYTGSITTGN